MEYFLSDSDLLEIKTLLTWHQQGRLNPTLRTSRHPLEDEEQMAPEAYVAKTPPGGIPALKPGTPGNNPTGTGSAGNEDQPGYAECYAYALTPELDRSGTHMSLVQEIVSLKGVILPVYNFSMMPIPGGVWVIVMRDKPGAWWVVQGGGGPGVLAMLTSKTYTAGQYTKYTWNFLQDNMPGQEVVKGVGPVPAYHVQNPPPGIDLPVGIGAVYLMPGNGAYMLIEMVAEIEMLEKTGNFNGGIYATGGRVRWNQSTQVGEIDQNILVVDLNA